MEQDCIEFSSRDRSQLALWNRLESLKPSYRKLTVRQYILLFQKCIHLDYTHCTYLPNPALQEYNWLGLRLLVDFLGGIADSEKELDTTENKLPWFRTNYYIHVIASVLGTSERKVYETILELDTRRSNL